MVLAMPGSSSSPAARRYSFQMSSYLDRKCIPVPSSELKHVMRGFPESQATLMEKWLLLTPLVLFLASNTSQVSGSLPKTKPLERSFGPGSKLKARWVFAKRSYLTFCALISRSASSESSPSSVEASLAGPKRRYFAFSGYSNTAYATAPSGSTSTRSELIFKGGMIHDMRS